MMLLAIHPGIAQGWKQYPYAPEGSQIVFPSDEGRHPDTSIEWWYTAGHLTGDSTGTAYSFMLTYFYYPALGYDGFRILNVANEATGEFFAETLPLQYDIMAQDSLNIHANTSGDTIEYWVNKTDDNGQMIPFEYSVYAESDNNTLALDYESIKPPLILGDDGYFQQGASSYTYYYSLTESTVRGILRFNTISEPVTGTAWVDRQYGTFNPLTEEDYEWFFIQLSNDMDINIYNLFTPDRTLPDTSTYKHMSVFVDSATQYTTHDFTMERLAYNYMPDSAMCYSSKWRLTASDENIDLIITVNHNNTEVQLPFRFFEGSTHVEGTARGEQVTGIGFAELLHAYEKPELAITYPSGEAWTSNRAIAWETLNPDEGRPLLYNLEFSTDGKNTFALLADNLTDPYYYWDDPAIEPGSETWFRITGHSIDSTLIGSTVSSAPSIYDPNLTALDEHTLVENRENKVLIFPNPADDQVFLELNEKHTYSVFQLMDLAGRARRVGEIQGNNKIMINVEDLAPGLYFLRLKSKETYTTSKLLVR